MEVNKTQAVLFMYDLLLEKRYFTKEEVISKLEVPNLTFLRYIQELRAYLLNFNKPYDLVFLNQEHRYILIKSF